MLAGSKRRKVERLTMTNTVKLPCVYTHQRSGLSSVRSTLNALSESEHEHLETLLTAEAASNI